MGTSATLDQIIEAVGTTYRAIDLRFAAVRSDGSWRNAFAIIRFSHQEPTLVAAGFSELEAQYGRARTDHFWIGNIARPFSDWGEVVTALRGGTVRTGDGDIRLREPITNIGQLGRLGRREYRRSCWPSLEVAACGYDASLLCDPNVERQVATLGFRDAYDIVRGLLEVDAGPNSACSVIVSAPVFAAVLAAKIDPKNRKVCVHYRHHIGLGDIVVSALSRGSGGTDRRPMRLQFTARESAVTADQICNVHATAPEPDWVAEDSVEFRLSRNDLGEIDVYSEAVRNLLPMTERNVLFSALSRFCTPSSLQALVANPAGQKRKNLTLDQSTGFELHVAWLLSAVGLQTIVLGDYEYLVHPDTAVRLATVDILAFDPATRYLILGACTMNPPKQEDFVGLLNLRRILEDEVFSGSALDIKTVIFTGARDHPQFDEIGNGVVPVVDSDLLADVVKRLARGEKVTLPDILPGCNAGMLA